MEDFLTFKKLMAKRNAELNAEALKMMLQKEKDALMKKAEEERIKKEAEERLNLRSFKPFGKNK